MAQLIIPNLTYNTQYKCIHCAKAYTRKSSLQKHSILCEILHQSSREKKCIEEESSDTPSTAQLYKILLEFAAKYENVEKRLNDMQRWTEKIKKKLDVKLWLNSNVCPDITYSEWLNKIVVTDDNITTLIEENFITCICNILQKYLIPYSYNDSSASVDGNGNGAICQLNPIYCFDQKINTFYVYDIEKGTGKGVEVEPGVKSWCHFTTERFVLLLQKIHIKIVGKLREWYKINKHIISSDDRMGLLYSTTASKLMNVNFSQDSAILTKMKLSIYNYLKIDLKRLIEYDFEF